MSGDYALAYELQAVAEERLGSRLRRARPDRDEVHSMMRTAPERMRTAGDQTDPLTYANRPLSAAATVDAKPLLSSDDGADQASAHHFVPPTIIKV